MRYLNIIPILLFLFSSQLAFAQVDIGNTFVGCPPNVITGQNSITANDANDAWAAIFQVPADGSPDILFRVGLTIESDDNGISVAVETVGTDGLPTGTDYGGSTPAVVTYADTDDNITKTASVGGTWNSGDIVAVVIRYENYSDGNGVFYTGLGNGNNIAALPYICTSSTGTFAKNSAFAPQIVLKYGSTYIVPLGCYPPGALTTVNIQSDTDPDEIALQFTAPLACRLIGWHSRLSFAGTTALIQSDLYDSSATPASLLASQVTVAHAGLAHIWPAALVRLRDPVSLTQSQVVYASVYSEDDTNNLAIYSLDVDDAAHFGNWNQHVAWAYRQRTTDADPDAGPAFTVSTTRKPLGGVIIDQITAGGSSVAIDPIISQ